VKILGIATRGVRRKIREVGQNVVVDKELLLKKKTETKKSRAPTNESKGLDSHGTLLGGEKQGLWPPKDVIEKDLIN